MSIYKEGEEGKILNLGLSFKIGINELRGEGDFLVKLIFIF